MKLTSHRHPDKQVKPKQAFDPNDVDLPDGLYLRVKAYCRSCGNSYNYDGPIEDFDMDMSYCGRSYRCVP